MENLIDKELLKKIVDGEKCAVHGQSASLEIVEGKINLSDRCCEEFHGILMKKIQEFMTSQMTADLSRIIKDGLA